MAFVTVNNTTANISGDTLLSAENSNTVTGLLTFNRSPNAPIAVAGGSAVVANLDSDMLDGQHGSYYTSASNLASGSIPVARLGNGVTAVLTTSAVGTGENYAPGLSGDTLIYCTNASALTIGGLSGGLPGQRVGFLSAGTGVVNFKYNSSGSSVGNKMITFASTGLTTIADGAVSAGYAEFVYSGARWEMTVHQQGAWLTPTFAAGDYTASAGNWTLAAGDVTTCSYLLDGRTLHFALKVVTTTLSGTPAQLFRVIPGGFTATKEANGMGFAGDNGGTREGLVWGTSAGGTTIALELLDATSWAASTDNTQISLSGSMQVT